MIVTNLLDRRPVPRPLGRGTGSAGRRRRRAKPLMYGMIGVLGLLAVWTAASQLVKSAFGIPRVASPWAVANEIGAYAADDLWEDAVSSLKIFAQGWAIGGVLAALLGVAIARVVFIRALLQPVVEIIRPISSIAWVPLSIVWFGFGNSSKVFVVGLAVFLVVIVYAVEGASRERVLLERVAAMLGMSRARRFRYLVIPGTLSEILIGLRVALTAGWGTVIVAELIAADTGLGHHLIMSQRSYNVAQVMATMVCFAAIGFLMNTCLGYIRKLLIPWESVGA